MQNGKIRVTVIIPHYNQTQLLRTLLANIANQTFREYEVIIIDDCSPDKQTVPRIKTFIEGYEKMRLIENTQNMRFIKTVNKGINLASGEYICLLNQDTEVKTTFLERNVEILDSDPYLVGLSCILVDEYGKIWWSGGSFKAGFPINLTDDFEGIRSVDFVAGTAAFYRKEVFNKIGLFDESYRMYHEDVEFGLRVRAKTDYKLCVFSDKLVVHYQAASVPSTEKGYLLVRNHFLIVRKYFPRLLPILILRHSAHAICVLGNDVRKLHPRSFLLHLGGFALGLRAVLGGLIKVPGRRLKLFR